MTAPAELIITGQTVIDILRKLKSIVEWQGGKDYDVKVKGNDGSYFYDKPSNIREQVTKDLDAYIKDNLVRKGKAIKYGGDCNPYIIDDPFMERESNPIGRDRYEPPQFKKYRRGSNYTKPKRRKKR